jgi:hypothetical protein
LVVEAFQAALEAYLTGETATAEVAFRRVLLEAPELWPAAVYLGLCREKQGRGVDAPSAFQHAIQYAARPAGATLQQAFRSIPELCSWREELLALAQAKAKASDIRARSEQ